MFQPKCWSSLIMILGSSSLLEKSGHLHPLSMKEPPLDFQKVTETVLWNGRICCLGFIQDFSWRGHWLILLNTEVNFTVPRWILLWCVPNVRLCKMLWFRSVKCNSKRIYSAHSSMPNTDSIAFNGEVDNEMVRKAVLKKCVQIVLKSHHLGIFFKRTERAVC